MSLNTRYWEWTVTPRRGLSGGAGPIAGCLLDFWLDGSELFDAPPPEHVDRLAAVRSPELPQPTTRTVHDRRRRSDSPVIEATPRPWPAPIRATGDLPDQRFHLGFAGAGPSGGFPVSATISFSRDTSFGGQVHFPRQAVGGGSESRRARDFDGDGIILDVSGGVAEVLTGQILFLDCPWNVFGGAEYIVHSIQNAFHAGTNYGWEESLGAILVPHAGLAIVGGYSSGAAGGVTLYTGRFLVYE